MLVCLSLGGELSLSRKFQMMHGQTGTIAQWKENIAFVAMGTMCTDDDECEAMKQLKE